MKATVYWTTTVSLPVEVEIPDDTPEDEREGAAIEASEDAFRHPGGMCWSCAGKFGDHGDFEPPSPGEGMVDLKG